jgi:hypothetical protein
VKARLYRRELGIKVVGYSTHLNMEFKDLNIIGFLVL